MTRLSGHKGVTRWLRRARHTVLPPERDRCASPIDVTVPEGVVVVLPATEVRALDWDAPPTRDERQRISVTPVAQVPVGVTVTVDYAKPMQVVNAPPHDAASGTPRAKGKGKSARKGKRR